jgi:murein DD-endopeptidase MepM/ murein hydrolase activator NlpD
MVGNSRTAIILLALLGLGFVWLRLGRSDEVRLSAWNGAGAVAQAAVAVAAVAAPGGGPGLSGVAVQQGQGLPGDLRPSGNPLRAANTVITQGYCVGTHAPAEAWGAIDYAIDGNGDGAADPDGTWDHPIYATHSGVVKVTPNSQPAGNHIWVTNDEYRTGYSHLSSFAVQSGQQVQRGDLIGYIGSTGMSSGPHLDYQIWEMRAGAWVNMNPMDFEPLN